MAVIKFDKEYSTQYNREREFLLEHGIRPSFVKIIDGATTYKYTKTPELFKLLVLFLFAKQIKIDWKRGDK